MNNRYFAIVVILISILLQACAWENSGANNCTAERTTVQTNSFTSETSPPSQEKNIYNGVSSETQNLFYAVIGDNSIDLAYANEESDGTTLGFKTTEAKYAEVWRNELIRSCDDLANLLSNEQKAEFLNAQTAWEENLEKNMAFMQNMYKSNYAQFGSFFEVELMQFYRENFRERTLYVKYLLFCLGENVAF